MAGTLVFPPPGASFFILCNGGHTGWRLHYDGAIDVVGNTILNRGTRESSALSQSLRVLSVFIWYSLSSALRPRHDVDRS